MTHSYGKKSFNTSDNLAERWRPSGDSRSTETPSYAGRCQVPLSKVQSSGRATANSSATGLLYRLLYLATSLLHRAPTPPDQQQATLPQLTIVQQPWIIGLSYGVSVITLLLNIIELFNNFNIFDKLSIKFIIFH